MRFLVLAWLCLLFLPGLLSAQGNVTIYGTVRDGSSAVIPAAEITVTNTRTGVTRNASAPSPVTT